MAQAIHMGQSADIVQAYRQQALLTRPEVKKLTDLDQDMADILARTDLTPNQKMKLYHTTLQRFTRVRNNLLEQGTMLPPPPPPPPAPLLEEIHVDDVENEQAPEDTKHTDIMKAFKFLLKDLKQNTNKSKPKRQHRGATTTKRRKVPKGQALLDRSYETVNEGSDTDMDSSVVTASLGAQAALHTTHDALQLKKQLIKASIISKDGTHKSTKIGHQSLPTELLNDALEYMTQSTMSDAATIPPHILTATQQIFTDMTTRNIDMSRYAKMYPYFSHLVNLMKRTKRRTAGHPATLRQQGSGIYKVNFHAWNKCLDSF
jgi:hypothetical protein